MKILPVVLKKIIVGSGFVPEKDFDEAAKVALELDKEVVDVLVFQGYINEDTVAKLISDYFKVPYANVTHVNIPQEVL